MSKILLFLGCFPKFAIISLTILQLYMLITPTKLTLDLQIIEHYVLGSVKLKVLPKKNKTVALDLNRLFCTKPLDHGTIQAASSNKSGANIGPKRKKGRRKITSAEKSSERKLEDEIIPGDDFTNLINLDKCLRNRHSYCFCMNEGIIIVATIVAIGVTLIFSLSDVRKFFSYSNSRTKTLDNELHTSHVTTNIDPPKNFSIWHLPHGCGYFMFSIVLWILWLTLGWVYFARIVVDWPFRLQILDIEDDPAFFDFYKLPRQWKFIIINCFVIATVILIDGAFQFTLSRPSTDYDSISTNEADKQASSDRSQKSS